MYQDYKSRQVIGSERFLPINGVEKNSFHAFPRMSGMRRIEQQVDSISYHILVTFCVSGTVLSMCSIISLNEREGEREEVKGGKGR